MCRYGRLKGSSLSCHPGLVCVPRWRSHDEPGRARGTEASDISNSPPNKATLSAPFAIRNLIVSWNSAEASEIPNMPKPTTKTSDKAEQTEQAKPQPTFEGGDHDRGGKDRERDHRHQDLQDIGESRVRIHDHTFGTPLQMAPRLWLDDNPLATRIDPGRPPICDDMGGGRGQVCSALPSLGRYQFQTTPNTWWPT